jgi:hypothetical protein
MGMRIASLFFFFVAAFCSCREPQPEKRVYTEKDVEGYWMSYPKLHPSSLLDAIAHENDSITDFLRLYNDVNGLPDTNYKVDGDILLIKKFVEPYFTAPAEFVAKYKILFASRDRIELREIKTARCVTLYSVFALPIKRSASVLIDCIWVSGDMGIKWSGDSLNTFVYDDGLDHGCIFGIPNELHVKSGSAAFSRMNNLYQRMIIKRLTYSNPEYAIIEPYTQFISGRERILFNEERQHTVAGMDSYCSDPCFVAAMAEFHATLNYVARSRE